MAIGPGNKNNLGANNRATNNAVGLGSNFVNARGAVKVLGAFQCCHTSSLDGMRPTSGTYVDNKKGKYSCAL